MQKILAFLFIVLIITPAIAIKNAPPAEWQSFIIYINFDGQRVWVDPDLLYPIDTSVGPPQPIKPGPYLIEINSISGRNLYKTTYQPSIGNSILYLPYFLNAKEVRIKNSNGKTMVELPTEGFLICNEDNQCSSDETELCPLDCPQAQNDLYPKTPTRSFSQQLSINQQPLPTITTTTLSVEPPVNNFTTLALIFAIGLVVIIIIVGSFYLLRRK